MSNRNLFSRIVKNENDVTELLVSLMQQKFFGSSDFLLVNIRSQEI